MSCSFALLKKAKSSKAEDNSVVEIAFCLDLSASTDELIGNFKLELWDLLLDINRSHPNTDLRLAIIGAGRAHYLKENNYINIISPLTNNLDDLFSKLYPVPPSIKVGKPNYVGEAISTAISKLKWYSNSIKIIYVIGNGQLTGKGLKTMEMADEAVSRGFIINAIFCSNDKNSKEMNSWRDLAQHGQGDFKLYNARVKRNLFNPTDKSLSIIKSLNSALNNSYINYSVNGINKRKQQSEIDSFAMKMHPANFQSRLFVKGSSLYQRKNADWDLVDLLSVSPNSFNRQDNSYIKSREEEFLPQFSLMKEGELKTLAINKSAERDNVLGKLNKISPAITTYLRKHDMEQGVLKDLILASLDQQLSQ